jgi:hypothetical protein
MKYLLIVLILALYFSNCTEHGNCFSVTVEYSSPWASPVKYSLTESSIIVNGVKSNKDVKTQTVYSRNLSKSESDSIFAFLQKTSYDTLNDHYENEHFFDGTTIIFDIKGCGLKSKTIRTYMRSTAITDSLEILVQRKVQDKRYQWNSYLNGE